MSKEIKWVCLKCTKEKSKRAFVDNFPYECRKCIKEHVKFLQKILGREFISTKQ